LHLVGYSLPYIFNIVNIERKFTSSLHGHIDDGSGDPQHKHHNWKLFKKVLIRYFLHLCILHEVTRNAGVQEKYFETAKSPRSRRDPTMYHFGHVYVFINLIQMPAVNSFACSNAAFLGPGPCH